MAFDINGVDMTQQFKFGSRVKRKSDGAVGVVAGISFQSVLVFFEGNSVSGFYDDDEFEIIPHPDTVRLEFIAGKYGATSSHARDVIDKEMK